MKNIFTVGVFIVSAACAAALGATASLTPRPSAEVHTNSFQLLPGQSLISQNGQYNLKLNTNGNLVLSNILHRLTETNTIGSHATRLLFRGDGDLVLYRNSDIVWESHTAGNPQATLNLQDDGNLVIYSPSGASLWDTKTSSGSKVSGSVPALVRGTLANSKIVNPVYPTSDPVISDYDAVEDYDADNTGAAEASGPIQTALNDCSTNGGGTVWLAAGIYKVSKTITIPAFCSVRGDWRPLRGDPSGGTIIYAEVAQADSMGNGPAVFSVGGSSTLMGVVIYYPYQDINAVTPYGSSVVIQSGGVNYMSSNVINVTLLNAYNGVAISPDFKTAHEVATVENLEGTVLSTGLFSTNSADVDVYENINLGPQYWSQAGALFNAPSKTQLADYTRTHATAFLFGDLEWSQFLNISATSFKIGLHTIPGSRIHFIGEFVGTQISDCLTGVQIDDVDTRFIKGAIFSGGAISGQIHSVVVNARGGATFNHTTLQGPTLGHVFLTDATESGRTSLFSAFQEPNLTSIPKVKSTNFLNVAEKPFSVTRVLPNQNGLIPFSDIDATSGIQAALTQAGLAGGGVVYLPAGWYYLGGNLSVPANVELRGASSGPLRTEVGSSGGTVLFTTVGLNSLTAINDPAFITLDGDLAGVSGLVIFYPNNNPAFSLNETYPYAIRGNGSSTYVKNIAISNGSYGIDFATYRNANHFIDRLVGLTSSDLITVGNGGGLIKNILSNSNFDFRNGFGMQRWPAEGSASNQATTNNDRKHLRLINVVYNDASPEIIANVFSYGADFGIFNQKPNVSVFNLGTDDLGDGYSVESSQPVRVQNVLRYDGRGGAYGIAPYGDVYLYNDSWIKIKKVFFF